MGQKAAFALEWSEQIELSADPQKNKGRLCNLLGMIGVKTNS